MHEPRESETLPDPSAELELLESLARCFVQRLPRKERMPFLEDVTKDLRRKLDAARVVHVHPSKRAEKIALERAKAATWWSENADKLA